jgi:hypothetical protein
MSESCCCSKNNCCSDSAAVRNAPVTSTSLSLKDMLGGWKARWGIGRMNYKVEPGLYAVGEPSNNSPVLVSANYKLTFDTLRKNLSGLDCWLLILDTKGVNVWCAAGKGTFGTSELVNRIETVGLSDVVTHRVLVLPQLGASGVSAHETAQRTDFSVSYGPVRANDIKAYFSSGCKATKEMRTVKFTLWDRLVLTPMELVVAAKKSFPIFGVLFLLNLFAANPFGIYDFIAYVGAVLMGSLFTPILLPFIHGSAFSWKGWLLGLVWTTFAIWSFGWFTAYCMLAVGYLLLLPSLSAYLAMNFTGCSTYTSPSGVIKEMKIALPLIIGSSIIGAVLILIEKLIG